MSAFSFQQHNHPLYLDPVFYSNTKIPAFSHEPNTTSNFFFPQFYQPAADPPQGIISMDFPSVHQSISTSSLEHSAKMIALSYNEPSVSNKQSPASSSVVLDQKLEIGEQVTQKLLIINPIDKKRKFKNGSSLNSAQSKDTRDQAIIKGKKQKKRSINGVEDKDAKENKEVVVEEAAEAPPPPPTGYIHVRARRGQATDSHSLAERVRREKISERMKLLQAIVPGCDKVTGKALMLDEIINYVQSLQNQVEFLSMKLATVNPMFYDFGVDLDAFMVKPDQSLSSLEPQVVTNVEQCRPNVATNNLSTAYNYPLLDSSTAASLLLQQAQMPNTLSQSQSQGNGHVLWGVDEQRQKFINQSTLSNNLSSFH